MANSPSNKTDSAGNQKVQCKVCSLWYHRLDVHLTSQHGLDTKRYQARFPGAPTISDHARRKASKGQRAKVAPSKSKVAKPKPKPQAEADDNKGPLSFGVATLALREGLGERDQAMVPVHDENWLPGKNEVRQLEELALGVECDDNVMVVGPPGIGKSTMVIELAAMLNQPLARVGMDGDMRRADFVGDKNVVVDQDSGHAITEWVDGVLPVAAERGWWLLIDEVDATPAHIAFILHGVLEKRRHLALTGDGGRVVKFHPNFRIIATANTLGRGDDAGMYAGTNLMNEALLDRFGVVIQAGYPDAPTEVDILVNRTGVEHADAGKMRKVAEKVREAHKHEQCFVSLSTRRLIDWAEKTVRLKDARRASAITIVNKLAGDDAKFVDNIIQRYFGGDVS